METQLVMDRNSETMNQINLSSFKLFLSDTCHRDKKLSGTGSKCEDVPE
jgi:hypothetical protein